MKKKYQVFISSTYSDLKTERQSAVEAVLRAGHIPAGMELFAAGNESQLEIIKRWIEDSDIYMLLLGGRYGSLESKSKLSYTEIEYRYALELNKPVFSLIMDEAAINKKVKSEGKDVLELDNPEKYKQFKALVTSKICRFFKDDTEIKLGVMESLLDIQSRFELTGWVKASEMPDINGLLKEIDELNDQNRKLSNVAKQNKPTKRTTINPNQFGDFSFEELKKLLTNEKVTIPASISTTGKSIKTHAYDLLVQNSSILALGISASPWGANEFNKFLLKNVVPILMTFDLVEKIKGTGSTYDKYQTSKLGHRYNAYFKSKISKK